MESNLAGDARAREREIIARAASRNTRPPQSNCASERDEICASDGRTKDRSGFLAEDIADSEIKREREQITRLSYQGVSFSSVLFEHDIDAFSRCSSDYRTQSKAA